MNFYAYAITYSASLFIGLILCLKIGHKIGRRERDKDKEGGGSALDGVVFAVLGLLLAFSFSSSIDSYNAHRNLLTKEANDISDAYAKLDLMPEEYQPALRTLLLEYADARLIATEAKKNSPEELAALELGHRQQDRIWLLVAEALKSSLAVPAQEQIVQTFTAMTGSISDQLAEDWNHMPGIIYALIFTLALMAALIAGYGLGTVREIPAIRMVVFALSIVVTVYVIIDLEYARSGIFIPSSKTLLCRRLSATSATFPPLVNHFKSENDVLGKNRA